MEVVKDAERFTAKAKVVIIEFFIPHLEYLQGQRQDG